MKHRVMASAFIAACVVSISAAAGTREECVKECQQANRDAVALCNTLYPPSSQPEAHRQCLAKAKDNFDGCMSTCPTSVAQRTAADRRR